MPILRSFAILAMGAIAAAISASTAASQPSQETVRGVVTLIKDIYGANADTGGNFLVTVPWDINTGRLARRVRQCQAKIADKIIDEDWPSDSQGQEIKDLTIAYAGSPQPGRMTVRARFFRYEGATLVDYDIRPNRHAPLRRGWGVHDMRIQDERGTRDLRKWLNDTLATECKGF